MFLSLSVGRAELIKLALCAFSFYFSTYHF